MADSVRFVHYLFIFILIYGNVNGFYAQNDLQTSRFTLNCIVIRILIGFLRDIQRKIIETNADNSKSIT